MLALTDTVALGEAMSVSPCWSLFPPHRGVLYSPLAGVTACQASFSPWGLRPAQPHP